MQENKACVQSMRRIVVFITRTVHYTYTPRVELYTFPMGPHRESEYRVGHFKELLAFPISFVTFHCSILLHST